MTPFSTLATTVEQHRRDLVADAAAHRLAADARCGDPVLPRRWARFGTWLLCRLASAR